MERAQVFSSRFSFTDCWHWVPWINSLWATSKLSAQELGHGLAALTLTWVSIDYSWSVCPLYKVCVWRSRIVWNTASTDTDKMQSQQRRGLPSLPTRLPSTTWGHSASWPVPRCGWQYHSWQLRYQRGATPPWLHPQLGPMVRFLHPLLRRNKFVNHTQHRCYNRLRRFVHINHIKID